MLGILLCTLGGMCITRTDCRPYLVARQMMRGFMDHRALQQDVGIFLLVCFDMLVDCTDRQYMSGTVFLEQKFCTVSVSLQEKKNIDRGPQGSAFPSNQHISPANIRHVNAAQWLHTHVHDSHARRLLRDLKHTNHAVCAAACNAFQTRICCMYNSTAVCVAHVGNGSGRGQTSTQSRPLVHQHTS